MIETDYSSLTQEVFERDVKRYFLYKLMLDIHNDPEAADVAG